MSDLNLVLTSETAQQSNFGQTGFEFPQPLTEKYRPTQIAEFVGLDKVKRGMTRFVANPSALNFLYLGKSGTGKTAMAFAVANAIPAEIHHLASKECTLEALQTLVKQCHYMPRMFNDWTPCKWHCWIIDEADQMSPAAMIAMLSILDGTNRPPNTIIILTANDDSNLNPDGSGRFMSRLVKFDFSNYGISSEVTDLLQRVWLRETSNPVETPNFQRIVKDSQNNVRASLMALETEIMCS